MLSLPKSAHDSVTIETGQARYSRLYWSSIPHPHTLPPELVEPILLSSVPSSGRDWCIPTFEGGILMGPSHLIIHHMFIQWTLWSIYGSRVKNPPASVGYVGSIPGLGRSPGEGNSNLLQYSCLKNSKDRGAWWDTVRGLAKTQIGVSD